MLHHVFQLKQIFLNVFVSCNKLSQLTFLIKLMNMVFIMIMVFITISRRVKQNLIKLKRLSQQNIKENSKLNRVCIQFNEYNYSKDDR